MRTITIAILVLVQTAYLFGATLTLQRFSAFATGSEVRVEFTSQNETGIRTYHIERAKEGTSNFVKVKEESPKGNFQTYTFLDEGPFFKPSDKYSDSKNSEDTYTYRIKAVYVDGSTSFSDVANVSHQTSSVNKTWGMIKEMFR
jgi:hypothetical protein